MSYSATTSSALSASVVGSKRGIGVAMFADFGDASVEQVELFKGVAAFDDQQAAATTLGGRIMKQTLTWVDPAARLAQQPVLVVMNMPGAGEAWDWDFLAGCEYACFAVVMECDAKEVFLQCIGRRAGALEQAIGLKLMKASTRYLVVQARGKGLKTEMEMMVDDYWKDFLEGGVTTSLVGGAPRGSKKGGSKGIFCVLDLNDEEHRVSSKAGGFDRMLG